MEENKKSNSWLDHVVDYQKKHNVTYREAMSLAKDSYVKKPKGKKKGKETGPKESMHDTTESMHDTATEEQQGIPKKKERKSKKEIVLTITEEKPKKVRKTRKKSENLGE